MLDTKDLTTFMEKISVRKLLEEIMEEGRVGPEHERLKRDLTAWAREQNFTQAYKKLPNESEPDVILTSAAEPWFLFVGDAKDSENETVDTTETVSRIQGYFRQFADLLGNPYRGGYLAIATNNAQEAARWVPVLNTLARGALLKTATRVGPDFRVVRLPARNTWVIFW